MKIKAYLQKLLKNNFVKSVVLISGGTAFAQLVTMISSPIITRIYTPTEYGVLTLFNSILVVFAMVGSLKYEMIIPIVDDEEESVNSIALSFIVLIIFVTFSIILFIFCGDKILSIFGAESLKNYWYLIPVGVLLIQSYRILTQYAYRHQNFKAITRTTAIQSLVGNLSKVLTGIMGFGSLGLLSSRIVSESMGLTTLSIPLLKSKFLFKKISFSKMKWLAKRYIRFPLYQFPSTLIGQLGINLPVFFLAFIYESKIVGAFGLANSVVRMPMNLIGSSVSNVFYAEAARIGKVNPERLKVLSDKLLRKLLLIGAFPLITFLLFGPLLFVFVYGDSWESAGVFARILSVLVYFNFIFSPVSRVYEVLEKQAQILILNIARIIVILTTFGIAVLTNLSAYTVIIFYTVGMSFMYYINYLMAQKYIKEAIVAKQRIKR